MMQIKPISSILRPLLAAMAMVLLSACSDESASPTPEAAGGDMYERRYSPSMGPETASVTLVEFFDPACEACRAFYPFVKQILQRHPEDVRLVLRYATFHQGSETVVRMLEAAREQGVFPAVLEALLAYQAEWASHHQPNIDRAWEIAGEAGLDIEAAKLVIHSAEFDRRLQQEKEDIRALKVSQTPTFFVNGKALPEFGAQPLYDLIVAELAGRQ